MADNISSSESEFLEDTDNDCNESLVEKFVEYFCGLEPYNFEPEAKTKQKQIRKTSTVECSVTDTPSRVGHIAWCNCSSCVEETREIDCLCCSEIQAIEEEKFEGIFFLSKQLTDNDL